VIVTIGHSTRTSDEFLALLGAHGVDEVLDVRRYPASRRHPHFARDALASALRAAGVAYRHDADLGGRRAPRPDSPHTAWRSGAFRGYADHMETEAFGAALERLMDTAADRTVALLCAEAVPWRCHRQLIADALVARGVVVRHIIGPRPPEPHRLSPFARVEPGGRIVYAAPSAQEGLFD
jgi:uncharacterized protein (DUF488 family)